MFAAANHLRFDFDNDGNQIGGWDMREFAESDDPTLQKFSAEISAATEKQPNNPKALQDVMRRS